MTQEEYSARNAQINAEYKKEQLRLQHALGERREELRELTKAYLEKKEDIEKEIEKLKVDMAEATARAAQTKADLNKEYLESLKNKL